MKNSEPATPTRDGSAYGRPPQHHDKLLTEVGPGTPCGELMRRYWHPIGLSGKLGDLPQQVRVLGEDLILFRDRTGRAGLLYPRCMHRGTSLFYGRTEDRGLRCCYHGWLFDVEGRCLEQPCEPEGGRHRSDARQPWYPVEERYGFVFAYLGPPEKKPILPRYDVLENLAPGEVLWSMLGGIGATGDNSLSVVPYSWLHMNDNIMDPFHVHVLHSTFSVIQFVPQFAVMPKVDFFNTDQGVCYSAIRELDDGQEVDRVSSWLMPNVMSIPDITMRPGPASNIAWLIPVDDTHYIQAMVHKVPEQLLENRGNFRGLLIDGKKTWGEMTAEEHQRNPADYEAQMGQGSISLHSEEHLVTSDRGIMLQRRLLKQQIEVVTKGGDPLGVVFEPRHGLIKVRAGNFFRTAQAASREAQTLSPQS